MSETGKPFFSVIVPAHNEEKYIEDTLQCLESLEYPKDRFEVIVVENGSTDTTRAKADAFARNNVRAFSCEEKGVSRARNFGLSKVSAISDWIIFLDADTHLAPSFFVELAALVSTEAAERYAVGGTSVRPFPSTPFNDGWYRFYDGVHELFRHTATITIARHALAKGVHFDEGLVWMEDFRYVETLRTRGEFFFLHTRSVSTSTRRLDKDGWFFLLFWQTLIGILPIPLQRWFTYSVVR